MRFATASGSSGGTESATTPTILRSRWSDVVGGSGGIQIRRWQRPVAEHDDRGEGGDAAHRRSEHRDLRDRLAPRARRGRPATSSTSRKPERRRSIVRLAVPAEVEAQDAGRSPQERGRTRRDPARSSPTSRGAGGSPRAGRAASFFAPRPGLSAGSQRPANRSPSRDRSGRPPRRGRPAAARVPPRRRRSGARRADGARHDR